MNRGVRRQAGDKEREGVFCLSMFQSAAPYILYACSVILVPLGINRFRSGSPVKGVCDLLGAGVIAIMAWSMGNP